MAVSNRMASFLATMKWEGGDRLSLDRRDPGNWTGGKIGVGALKGTKWGVSASAYPTLDVAKLTADDALSIFVAHYWRPIGADELPAGLDHCASDDAYNAGPGAALRRLKKIAACSANLSIAARVQQYSQLRLSFLESLRGWRVFGRGWARRVAAVEAESLKMALAAQAASPACAPRQPVQTPTRPYGLLTPADLPPRRPETMSANTIAETAARAEEAAADARRRVAIITTATIGAAPWLGAPAPGVLVGLVVVVAALVATQLWAWRTQNARRDALASLVAELGTRAAG